MATSDEQDISHSDINFSKFLHSRVVVDVCVCVCVCACMCVRVCVGGGGMTSLANLASNRHRLMVMIQCPLWYAHLLQFI